MSLSKEEIIKNAKTFFKTGEKYGFINDALIDDIGNDIMNAPCTLDDKGYNSFEGGLVQHALNCTKYALSLNKSLPEDKQVADKSLITVAILHQIGKAKMFVQNTQQWQLDKGINYSFSEGTSALNVSQLTLKYIWKYKLDITEDEYDAIALYGSEFGGRPFSTLGVRIAAIIKSANIIAMTEEK
jgi:hypothetical protein